MSILDDIADKLEQVTWYDNYLSALCPFHDDRRPSFMVYEDWYRCASCEANGSTKSLANKLSGAPVKPKQVKDFHNPFTNWLKDKSLNDVLLSAWQRLNRQSSTYLTGRKIPDEHRKKLGIGYLDNWYTFPIKNEKGKLVGAVARSGDPNMKAKYVTPFGQSSDLLYVPDWKLVNDNPTIYLVFGIIDAVTLYVAGIPSISTTGGKRLNPLALENIRKRIIFIPDKGEEQEAMQIATCLGWRGAVAKTRYPAGTKDVNEVVIKYGFETLNLLMV